MPRIFCFDMYRLASVVSASAISGSGSDNLKCVRSTEDDMTRQVQVL